MKYHILLVDDDKDELDFFLDALSKVPHQDGFKCTYASTGEHAIEMLKYLVPDMIFVDINMPTMNGLEFLSHLENNSKLANVKTYLYSTSIGNDTYKKVRLFGAAGCIKKERSISDLTESLKIVICSSPDISYVFSGSNKPGHANLYE